jgi:hypothetical protein
LARDTQHRSHFFESLEAPVVLLHFTKAKTQNNNKMLRPPQNPEITSDPLFILMYKINVYTIDLKQRSWSGFCSKESVRNILAI